MEALIGWEKPLPDRRDEVVRNRTSNRHVRVACEWLRDRASVEPVLPERHMRSRNLDACMAMADQDAIGSASVLLSKTWSERHGLDRQ